MIKEEILSSVNDILKYESGWKKIVEENKLLTPFQYPNWIITWWYNFGSGELFVYTVSDNKNLLFLAPCFIRKIQSEKEKKLVFIGTGNTDFQDCIYENNSEFFNNFADCLYKKKSLWDLIDFIDISPGSPLNKAFPSNQSEIVPILELPDSYDNYLKSTFQKKKKDELKRQLNLLNHNGGVDFQISSSENVQEFYEELLVLNLKRWHGTQNVILFDVHVRSLLSEVSRQLSGEGTLKFFRLVSKNKTIAINLSFLKNDSLYSYMVAYDPDFQKYSPGVHLNLKMIEWCISNKYKRYNFLRGPEEYKFSLGAQIAYNYRITF